MARVVGYNPEHGKSSYLMWCECGEWLDFYVWSGRKRCPKCKRMYVYGRQGIELVVKSGESKTRQLIPVPFSEGIGWAFTTGDRR